MAASSYLQKKANRKAKEIDKEYGEGQYGGTWWQSTVPSRESSASAFLQNKVKQREKVLSAESYNQVAGNRTAAAQKKYADLSKQAADSLTPQKPAVREPAYNIHAFGAYQRPEKEKPTKTYQELLKEQKEYEAARKEHDRLLGVDLDALGREIDALKPQAAAERTTTYNVKAFGGYDANNISQAERDLAKKQAEYNRAKEVQDFDRYEKMRAGLTPDAQKAFDTLGQYSADLSLKSPTSDDLAKAKSALKNMGYSDSEIKEMQNAATRLANFEKYNAALEKWYNAAQGNGAIAGIGGKAWATLASIPANLASGIGVISNIGVENPDFYNAAMRPYAAATGARQGVEDTIKSNLGKEAYRLGTSMLDSATIAGLTALGIPAAAGSVLLGGSAATSAMMDAHQRGLSDQQAVITGVAAGIFETAFEKISLDKLMKTGALTGTTREQIKQVIRNAGKQAGIEGSEELMTDYANFLFDHLANGGLSQYQQRVQEYIDSGMNETAAENKATADMIQQMAMSFVGGAISGGIMGGVAPIVVTATNDVNNARAYRGIYGENAGDLADEALSINPDSKAAQDVKNAVESGKKVSGYKIRQLVNENKQAIQNEAAKEQSFLQEKSADFGDTAEYFLRNKPEGASAADYYAAYKAVYDMGKEFAGSEQGFETVKASIKGTVLSEELAYLAYKAGAVETENTVKGESENESGSRSQEWQDGVAGQQEPVSVERKTSVLANNEQRGRAASVKSAVDAAGVESQNGITIGIADAAEDSSIRVVPQSIYTDEMKSVERKNLNSEVKTVFFVDPLKINETWTDDSGNLHNTTVRGAISDDGKTIYIRADHEELTIQQINDHEEFHRLVKKDRGLVERTKKKILEKYDEKQIGVIVRKYADLYDGAKLTDSELLEEILCDAYAGIDVVGAENTDSEVYGGATKFTEEAVTSAVESYNMRNVLAKNGAMADNRFSREVDREFQEKFSGKVTFGNGIKVSNREIALIASNLKTGYGIIDEDGLGGSVNTYERHYLFDVIDDTVYVVKAISNERLNIHRSEVYSRDEGDKRADKRIGRADEGGRAGQGNSSEYISSSGRGSGQQKNGEVAATEQGSVRTRNLRDVKADSPRRAEVKHSREVDSTGRQLTEQQAEYFKDSKVRDKDGNLLVVYHGSGNKFTEFSADFMSMHGSSEGQGFYFTDNRNMAKGYQKTGGQLLEGYLDIKNPLSDSNVTMTRSQVKRLLRSIDPTGDDVVINYDSKGGIGYPSKVWYERSLEDATRMIFENAESDSEILAEIANSGAGAENTMATAKTLLGYDGYIVADKYDGKSVFVAFESNQFKNVDNTAPTKNEDIRYSRDLQVDLRKENEKLRDQVEKLTERKEYFKAQGQRTGHKVHPQIIQHLAGQYVKNTTLDAEDITAELQSLGDFMHSQQKKDGLYQDAKDRALSIAEKLVQNAQEIVNPDEVAMLKELRKSLRDSPVSVSDEIRKDFVDWSDWRRRNSYIVMKNGATPVDVRYEELRDTFGEYYFPSDIINPAEQLRQIAKAAELMGAKYENPNSYYMAEATEIMANQILRDMVLPTRTDRLISNIKLKAKASQQKAVSNVRAQRDEKIAKLKEQEKAKRSAAVASERTAWENRVSNMLKKQQAQKERAAEKRIDSEMRTRLLKLAKRLQNKKLPAVTRAMLDQYIGDLDTVSRGITGKTISDLQGLKAWYDDRKQNDPDFISSPAIEKRLERLNKRRISDMTQQEVAELTEVLLNIENEIRTEKKLIDSQVRIDTYNAGLQSITDIENSGGGNRSIIDRKIVNDTLSPIRAIHRYSGYNDNSPIYIAATELSDGQRKMLDYQRKAEDHFRHFTDDKAFMRKISGKHAEIIEITGKGKYGAATTVKITPAMRISLFLHSLCDQNLAHIADGGITVPDISFYQKGDYSEAYKRGTTIKLTPSQVRAITSRMTEKERAFAMVAKSYFDEISKPALNETSEKLVGFSIAGIDAYFPINTNTNFNHSDFESIKMDGSIEGMGFLQERTNAHNPIYLRDLDTVLNQSIRMHSKYVGLAIPVRNFNKLWNVTTSTLDENGNIVSYSDSVKDAIGRMWGVAGSNYIEKMMADLQNSRKEIEAQLNGVFHKIRSNYAGATLTLNAGVAMKQVASYPTAAAVIGFEPLIKAMGNFGAVDLKIVNTYTPLQWYRSKGFSSQELGDMTSNGGVMDKILKAVPALNWVQGADLLTTRKLWKACEIYVSDNFNLKRGTIDEIRAGKSAYYQKVAEVYNRVIEETQPNYATMQRPNLLRSHDVVSEFMMFKTQPFQNFNILFDSYANMSAKKAAYEKEQTADRKAAYDEAKKSAYRATTSQIAQLAVFAGMTFVWNIFRGKRDKYKDDDEEMTAISATFGIGKDMIGGLFSNVPFGSEAWSAISSIVFKEKYYGFDSVTASAITDMTNALLNGANALKSVFDDISSGNETDFNKIRIKLDSVIDATSKVAGAPYENITNLFNATFRLAAISASGEYKGNYAYLMLTVDPSVSTNRGKFYDLLYEAYKNDKAAHKEIYARMIDGEYFDADDIKNAMETRMKKEQGVNSVKELKNRYKAP